MRRAFSLSVAANLLLATALGIVVTRHRELRREIALASSGWLHQPAAEGFATLPSEPGCTVFLGDSLTAEAPWGELLGDLLNRGLKGDTAERMERRLDEVLEREPGRLFLQIGINDLQRGRTPEAVADAIERIARRVRELSPDTHLYLISLLPVRSGSAVAEDSVVRLNTAARETNERLTVIASRLDADYVDVYARVCDESRRLREDLTYDGLHLTAAGYLIWRDELRSRMK